MSGADTLTRLAVGVDIVETARLRRLVDRWGESFLARLFTDKERAALHGTRGLRWDSLAGRFAAKEATRKVFGSRGQVPRWLDIEVLAGEHGEPILTLLGEASFAAECCGFHTLHLSIAHEKRSAVAVVVAV